MLDIDSINTLYNNVLRYRRDVKEYRVSKDKYLQISLMAAIFNINLNEQDFKYSKYDIEENDIGYAYKNLFANITIYLNNKLSIEDRMIYGLYLIGNVLLKDINNYQVKDIIYILKDKKDIQKDNTIYGNIYLMFIRDILFNEDNLKELLDKLRKDKKSEKR